MRRMDHLLNFKLLKLFVCAEGRNYFFILFFSLLYSYIFFLFFSLFLSLSAFSFFFFFLLVFII